jgi:Resolvase, N terminal domain
VASDVVFGYVRLARSDQSRLRGLRQQIVCYCGAEELSLELVFGDCGVHDNVLTRPGWTALMDRLSYTSAYAVVVPSLDHLSRDPVLRTELRTQVVASGAVVLVMPTRSLSTSRQGTTA